MSEHDFEPIRGLPGELPKDEILLWQGAPDWWALGQRAFHMRSVALYFLALMIWRSASLGSIEAGLQLAPLAIAGLGLLAGLAALTARTTVYTLTNKRLVMRFGIALPKAINIPFKIIANAALRTYGDKSGDVSILLTEPNSINYFLLWPHARPWKLSKPQPTLRAIADAKSVTSIFAAALEAAQNRSSVNVEMALPPRATTPVLTPA